MSGSRIPPLSATQQLPSSITSAYANQQAQSAPVAFVSSVSSITSTPLSATLSPALASPRHIPTLLPSVQSSDAWQQQQSTFTNAAASLSPRSGRLAPLSHSAFTNTLTAYQPSAIQSAAFSPFAVAQQSLLPTQFQAPLSPVPTQSLFPTPLTPAASLAPQPHPYASNDALTSLQAPNAAQFPSLAAHPLSYTQPLQQQQPYSTQAQPAATLRPLPDIASLLASCSLQQYAPSFYQTGYTDMASLLTMPTERWQLVLDAVTKDMLVRLGRGEVTDEQLQFGHRQAIVAALQREREYFFSASSRPATAPQPYLLPPSHAAYATAAPTPLSTTDPAAAVNGEAKPADASADRPVETTASPPSLPSLHHSHLATIVRHWCCSFIIGAVFLLFSGALFLLWQELQVAPATSSTSAAPKHAVTGFNFLKALCVIGFVVGGVLVLVAMRLFCKYPEHRRCGEWCGECCVPDESGCCTHGECCVKWRNWCTVCCANLPCDTCCTSCRSCCATDPNAPGCCDWLCKTDPNAVSCCNRLGDAWTCLWKGALAALIGLWSFICCTTPSAACCATPEASTCCSLSKLCGASSAPFSCRHCMHDWGCGGLCCDEDGTDECCVPCRTMCDHSECCSGGCWHGCQQSTCYKIVCCQCKISVL